MWLLALIALLLEGCWVDNPHYLPPPDAQKAQADLLLAPPDLTACPTYPAAGGGGKDRPQVQVPGGTYDIGGTLFAVPDFYLDVFLVTVAAYRDCVAEKTCSAPPLGPSCNFTAAPGNAETQPVNCVTFSQAQAFCQWAGRRLPGEGEWQYAAAGKMMSLYPWGADAPRTGPSAQLCWAQYESSDMGQEALSPCPVGSHEKTLSGHRTCLGVADLSGDVWEWTGTEYKDPYVYPEVACSTSSAYCSIRGGSFYDLEVTNFQSATRNSDNPSDDLSGYGFRCAAPVAQHP